MWEFDMILAIVNVIAVVLSPIIAVLVGQFLQNRAEKRKDKMAIFQCLMTHRMIGWTDPSSVNALNLIDIVFSDCEPVRAQWKILLSKYRPEFSKQEQEREQCKLLELMAKNLGYKKKITWDTIQNPYYPVGLSQQRELNSQIITGQAKLGEIVEKVLQSMPGSPNPTTQPSQEDTAHADA